jgi:hypothetical protein
MASGCDPIPSAITRRHAVRASILSVLLVAGVVAVALAVWLAPLGAVVSAVFAIVMA